MTRKILVPIDVSETELTEKVITWVEAQARIDDAEIHFLTVVPVLPYYMSLGQGMVDLPDIHQIKSRAEKKLAEIVARFSLPDDRKMVHCVEGTPRDTILEMAKNLPADLVIISSHRPDITTYLLGSNAAAVVRHAECPVLVIR